MNLKLSLTNFRPFYMRSLYDHAPQAGFTASLTFDVKIGAPA